MKRFTWRKEKDGWILYDKENEEIFFINEIGKFIFEKIIKGYNFSSIIQLLMKKYNLPERKIKKDIKDFFNKLKDYKLIG